MVAPLSLQDMMKLGGILSCNLLCYGLASSGLSCKAKLCTFLHASVSCMPCPPTMLHHSGSLMAAPFLHSVQPATPQQARPLQLLSAYGNSATDHLRIFMPRKVGTKCKGGTVAKQRSRKQGNRPFRGHQEAIKRSLSSFGEMPSLQVGKAVY